MLVLGPDFTYFLFVFGLVVTLMVLRDTPGSAQMTICSTWHLLRVWQIPLVLSLLPQQSACKSVFPYHKLMVWYIVSHGWWGKVCLCACLCWNQLSFLATTWQLCLHFLPSPLHLWKCLSESFSFLLRPPPLIPRGENEVFPLLFCLDYGHIWQC